MKGIGLVFAGGGGKGAYEIGVWKYFHEVGLDRYVKAVSGTSVGALNAALFVGSDYETAERLWLNIKPTKILSPKKVSLDRILKWCLLNQGMIMSRLQSITKIAFSAFVQVLSRYIRSDYLFSRDGIIDMISEGVDFVKLQNSEIPCFATCLKWPSLKVTRFELNEYEEEGITKILLASSAIPIVFPQEKFEGENYYDGGLPVVGDNIPIQPVYDMGLEYIIVVNLSREAIIEKEKYPNSKIIEIVPSRDLGNAISGTLDFTTYGSAKRIDLGYADVKKMMQPMVDMILMSVEKQRRLVAAQNRQIEFEKRINAMREEIHSSIDTMENDGLHDAVEKLRGRVRK